MDSELTKFSMFLSLSQCKSALEQSKVSAERECAHLLCLVDYPGVLRRSHTTVTTPGGGVEVKESLDGPELDCWGQVPTREAVIAQEHHLQQLSKLSGPCVQQASPPPGSFLLPQCPHAPILCSFMSFLHSPWQIITTLHSKGYNKGHDDGNSFHLQRATLVTREHAGFSFVLTAALRIKHPHAHFNGEESKAQ